jgi:hypothetical protein
MVVRSPFGISAVSVTTNARPSKYHFGMIVTGVVSLMQWDCQCHLPRSVLGSDAAAGAAESIVGRRIVAWLRTAVVVTGVETAYDCLEAATMCYGVR